MREYVRVKDNDTGHHYTVLAQEVEASPDAFTVLKQPAVNELGDPLPGEIPSATTTKSPSRKSAKKTTAKKTTASTPPATPTGQSADTPKES